jgi:hypothetical protein
VIGDVGQRHSGEAFFKDGLGGGGYEAAALLLECELTCCGAALWHG